MYTAHSLYVLVKKAVKKRYGVDTNYQIHKVLDVSQTTVKRWEDGKTMDANSARKIAIFLNLNPQSVMAWCAAEAEKDEDTKQEWIALATAIENSKAA